MTLSQFIEKHGDEACAVLFKVKPRTVASWRRGENFPRAKKAQEIIALAKGEITMDGIYQSCTSEKAAA